MKNVSFPWALVFVTGLAAAYLSPSCVTVMLILLGVWLLRGPAECVQSLTLATLLTYLSPAIAEPTSESGIIARVVLILAALRFLPTLRSRDLRTLWPVCVFSVLAAILSTISSSSVPISIMKVLTFAVAVSTVITAYNSLSPNQVARLQKWYATLAVVFVVASLATLATPRIAFLRNGTGLQGIVNHPQALATALAPLAAWQLAGMLFVRGSLRWFGLSAVALIYAALFLSESRTGVAASLIGVVAAALTWMFAKRRHLVLAGRTRVFAMTAAAALFLAAALGTGHFQGTLLKFAFKRAESREVTGAFFESRGGGIASQWQNFVDRPWIGHGFGVFAEGPPASSVVEILGIPISAPVEKGFVFTAVLEETGLAGGFCFVLMLVVFGRAAWKNQDLRWVAMFTTCIAVNIGESILLAPGGVGLFDWLLIGLAIASGRSTGIASEPAIAEPGLIRFPNLMRTW
jgi:hypothetical protein